MEDVVEYLKRIIESSCKDLGYQLPSQKFYNEFFTRLPEGVRILLSIGIEKGIVIPVGKGFKLKGLDSKGPYSWFANYKSIKSISVNWEYFVHAAEFVRLKTIMEPLGYTLTFEDDLMDIGVYKNNKLVMYCEVKEKARQIQKLVNELMKYQDRIDKTANDRGNDPLRKAKYIIKNKPEYFLGVAIGKRLEYSVIYPQGKAFQLKEDMVPLL